MTDFMDAVVVTPLTDLDREVAEQLRPELMSAAGEGRDVVVDLHAVHLIDSAGLGLLVRAHQEAKQNGGRLALVAPSRFVLTVLHTMRLDGVFDLYPDRSKIIRPGT
ncbi:anti-sigma B factor antagonist [Actinoplanes lutulentus]|uniref:Anti-sigma factor antagonist n=1 Tax=Actinoplanes lutulentus TaxID=1287878 RepID=A0A327ZDV1_9ACTN|nr:anti-sigma B factor antagonist [Actinoplanes lutulentus]RAK36916.1 anti-sigma B factor antagonist [Actinoplanes lutulentus]